MSIVIACAVFVLIALAGSAAGHEALRAAQGGHGARGRRGGRAVPSRHPHHASLVFHDLVKRLGDFVPASPKDVTVMQRRLIRAGYRNRTGRSKFCTAPKLFLGFLCRSLAGLLLSQFICRSK